MVLVEEIIESLSPSEERKLDAEEIASLVAKATRPAVRMHLEGLVKKLNKESEALKRVEASKKKMMAEAEKGSDTEKQEQEEEQEEKPVLVEEVETKRETKPSNDNTSDAESQKSKPAVKAPATTSAVPSTDSSHHVLPTAKYIPIDKFAFDSGGYNSQFVTIYVDMKGVGKIDRSKISSNFTPASFDLVVNGFEGKSYRLFKDNLAKDIDPQKSKHVVKPNKIIIKLSKIKTDYGYDSWTDLIDKRKKRGATNKQKTEDPHQSIMGMMKDMYESGDDNMRKVIGETMEKQRRGELGKDKPTGDNFGLGSDF